MHPILSLLLGFLCSAVGGDWFVRGAIGLASWARIPAAVIGATVAAFATSSPELAVSIDAAAAGAPQIALGDALGANVVNLGFILGLALLFGPLQVDLDAVRRDQPALFAGPLITAVLLLDGALSRSDGAVLLVLFTAWLVWTVRDAWRARANHAAEGQGPRWRAVAAAVAGLFLLIAAGRLIVDGAKWVGDSLGWSEYVVGASLVAMGTTMPELATTIASRRRGHDDVGMGTVLGSNIFNGLFIVGIAASIAPIPARLSDVWAGLAFGLGAFLVVRPRSGIIPKQRAWLALGLYAAYLASVLLPAIA